jgi:hypothetical protein
MGKCNARCRFGAVSDNRWHMGNLCFALLKTEMRRGALVGSGGEVMMQKKVHPAEITYLADRAVKELIDDAASGRARG